MPRSGLLDEAVGVFQKFLPNNQLMLYIAPAGVGNQFPPLTTAEQQTLTTTLEQLRTGMALRLVRARHRRQRGKLVRASLRHRWLCRSSGQETGVSEKSLPVIIIEDEAHTRSIVANVGKFALGDILEDKAAPLPKEFGRQQAVPFLGNPVGAFRVSSPKLIGHSDVEDR